MRLAGHAGYDGYIRHQEPSDQTAVVFQDFPSLGMATISNLSGMSARHPLVTMSKMGAHRSVTEDAA